jgi:hypothetical protein
MGGTAAAPTINFLIFGRKRLNSARAAAAAGSRLEKGYSPTLFHYTHTLQMVGRYSCRDGDGMALDPHIFLACCCCCLLGAPMAHGISTEEGNFSQKAKLWHFYKHTAHAYNDGSDRSGAALIVAKNFPKKI